MPQHLNFKLVQLYSPDSCLKIFNELESQLIYLNEPKLYIYNRYVRIPRQIAAYGDPKTFYTFSGLTVHARPWNDILLQIKAKVESETKETFNFVLINRYADGNCYISKHRDNERGLIGSIAAVSFGEERKFEFSRDGFEKVSLNLSNGSLLIMKEPTNKYWYHSLPKAKTNKVRISLTFRRVIT